MGKRDIQVTVDDIVRRATSMIGRGIYKMSKGGRDPRNEHPFNDVGQCDCSGFVAWCIGLDRWQPGRIVDDWIETTAIVADASGAKSLFAMFKNRQPGDIIVYGDRDGKQGHVGIATYVVGTRVKKVVHCSHGNWRSGNGAVQETDPDVFLKHNGVVTVRYRGIVERKS